MHVYLFDDAFLVVLPGPSHDHVGMYDEYQYWFTYYVIPINYGITRILGVGYMEASMNELQHTTQYWFVPEVHKLKEYGEEYVSQCPKSNAGTMLLSFNVLSFRIFAGCICLQCVWGNIRTHFALRFCIVRCVACN